MRHVVGSDAVFWHTSEPKGLNKARCRGRGARASGQPPKFPLEKAMVGKT